MLILISLVAVILIFGIFILIFVNFQLGIDVPLIQITDVDSLQYWGQLGDFFGGILNPLLSFVALIAVLYNIRMQSDGLAEARREAAKTNIIQRQQAKIFERQNFDSIFFGLLNAQASMLRDVRIVDRGVVYEGRRAFEYINEQICGDQNYYDDASVEQIKSVCEIYYESFQQDLGHYFRNLYHILKTIDLADALRQDHEQEFVGEWEGFGDIAKGQDRRFIKEYFLRRQYSNILRAQLSSHEVTLLLLNCLTPHGAGLKPYVEIYSMLKTIRRGDIFGGRSDIIEQFDDLAYEDYENINFSKLKIKVAKFRRSRVKRALGK